MKQPGDCVRRERRKSREYLAKYGEMRRTEGYGEVENSRTPDDHDNIGADSHVYLKWPRLSHPLVSAIGALYMCFLFISVLGHLNPRTTTCGTVSGGRNNNAATTTGLANYENFQQLSLPWKAVVVLVGLPLYGVFEIVPYELANLLCYLGQCISRVIRTLGHFIVDWILAPVWNLLTCMARGIRWIGVKLWLAATAFVEGLTDWILIPIGRVILNISECILTALWDWILYPLGHALCRIVDLLIIQPIIWLHRILVRALTILLYDVIWPVLCWINDWVIEISHVLTTIVETLLEYIVVKPLRFLVVTVLCEHVIQPLWRHLLYPLGELVFRVVSALWRITCELFWFFYSPIRAFVARVCWFVYDVVWGHILCPVLSLLYDMASQVLIGIWQTLVPPLRYIWGAVAGLVSTLVSATSEAVSGFIAAINDVIRYFSHVRSEAAAKAAENGPSLL